jgi:hypothetical protein
LLHIIQPVARLRGRIKHGLTPWRIRGAKASLRHLTFFKPKTLLYWSEGEWKSPETWLEEIEDNIIKLKARVRRGNDFDKWDLKTRNGLFSTAKGVLTIEEHGANKQYLKFRYWANYSVGGLLLVAGLVAVIVFAALDKSWVVCSILSILTALVGSKYVLDSASVVNCIVTGFTNLNSVTVKESKLKLIKNDDYKAAKNDHDKVMQELHAEKFVNALK